MNEKVSVPLVEPLELRVTDADGETHDYATTGVDVYRVEKFTGKTAVELTGSYTAVAYMAYSCARRAGHAYRQRKASTSEAELFESWLETHTVVVLADSDGEADPKGDDDPGSSPADSSDG